MQATYPPALTPSPVRLEGQLERPSRWLWLVKWLLVLPHYFVLAFLWLGFVVLSLVAFVALLFGGGRVLIRHACRVAPVRAGSSRESA